MIFSLVFFLLWLLARSNRNRRFVFLIIASCVFYGWADWRYLILIALIGFTDYTAALCIHAVPRYKRFFLIGSIATNLAILSLCKYSSFFLSNIDVLLSVLGLQLKPAGHFPDVMLALPLGISFYTFSSMSYTIDVYRGTLQPTRSLLHFFAYLSLFPKIIAGPIVRAKDLLPQLSQNRRVTQAQIWDGIRLITYGYFKKTVIADSLEPIVSAAFSTGTLVPSSLYWWAIMAAFSIQIYCDFSGYSDIATGLGKWMGYDFSLNFNRPYSANSMRDFWGRWHITLSSWFRDYVYIPLGGSRCSKLRSHLNMWITMLLSGLWHGAAWTFVMWGAAHATFLSIERLTKWPQRISLLRWGSPVCTLLVILQAWFAWLLFRSTSLAQYLDILKIMFSFTEAAPFNFTLDAILVCAIMIARELYCYCNLHEASLIKKLRTPWSEAIGIAILITACIYFRGPGSKFIYSQF